MPYPPAANIAQDCLGVARQLDPCRRYSARIALAIALCLGGSARVDGQSIVGGRNVNIAGGKQVISINPYEVRGDVLNRAQNEPSCAISTRNPKNILCGANDYRMIDVPGVTTTQIIRDAWLGEFQSADGGDTWESTLHRGFYLDPRPHPLRLLQLRAAADPTVRSGPAGLAFYSGISFTQDRSRSVVFVTTYADLSTREDDKQPFKYVRTAIPDVGTTGRFIDKPWMFVEAAPAGQTCTINAQVERNGVTTLVQQTVPASIVHLVYSVFVDSTDTLAQLIYVRSDNCGTTFTRPKQLNVGTQPANGAAIAKPLNSNSRRVFTAWRRVQTPTSPPSNAIIGAISDDNGNTWSAPLLIADICPFDQGTTTVSFRTTAFPSMTADATGRAYVAWADRGRLPNGQCNPEGAARIHIATSTNGVTWTQSEPVPSATPEHQILPSIVFTAGRLALGWLDFREDASQVFGRFVSEAQVQPVPGIRHTADVRASMAMPGVAPNFDQPTLISEYLRGVGFANGQRVATQLQWNAVNRRWARRGTVPFNGDYIDIATLPYLPPDPASGSTAWIPNNQAVVQTALGPAPRVPLLLLAWTDNRDMRTGPEIDIPPGHDPANPASPQPQPVPFVVPTGLNLPPGSIADPTQVRIECTTTGDVYKTGTTNQNAYTARATIGVAAGTPANNKVLGNLQRSFVVFVRNDTLAGKTFKLVASQPAGGFATFDQFDTARTTTDIFVPARSSVSRTVFVTRNPGSPVPLDPDALIRVDVIETQGITPIQVTTIYINSDPSAPEIDSPEIDSREVFSPEIDSPEIDSPEIDSPEIDSRGFSSPEIDSPEIDSPEIDSPEIDSPEIDSNEILSLGLQTPEIDSPEIDSPEIDSPEIDSPEIDSPEIDSSAITDITFKVTNDGNTTGQYNAKALVGNAAGPGFRYQVIVRRTYALPAVGADCQPTTIAVSKVAVNLQDVTPPSPEIDSPEIDSPEIDSPEIDSSAIDTASFFVAPEETVEVVVRVRSRAVPTIEQLRAVLQNVDLAVQQEAVNSDDVAVGITEPPVITSFLSVATQALAAGQTTAGYTFALQASGGPEPHQWSLTGGTLPPGIVLSPAGQLTGSPTADGTYTFTVRVVDADGNMASRAFALSVTTPGTPALAFVTQPSNPILGAIITPYPSVRALNANGNPASGVAVTLQLIGGGTLTGTLTRVTGPSGIAVFDDLRLAIPAAGTALLASAPTFTNTTSVAFGTTQPDLIIESLTHSPINPTSVDSLTITAVVKNVGNGPSGPTTISLLVAGENPGDEGTVFPVPPLAPGATYTVQRLAPPVGEGPKSTSATVDGNNTVTESAEGNNGGADSFVATPQAPPVAAGLVSWWRGEGDGNDSIDGSHGTLIGGVEFAAGRTGGQAFELDGVNDRIDVGPGFNLDDLTLSAWVFIDPATNQGDRVVISKDNIGGAGVRKAFVLKSSNTFSPAPGNRPAFMVLIGNPPDPTSPLVDLLEGPASLSAGWHHLAGVRDTSSGRFELYIDGVMAASKVPTVVGLIDSVVNTVIGGVNPAFFGQFFAGRIDDPQIFDQALTSEQISALATASSESVVHSPVSAEDVSTEPLLVRDAQGVGGDANRDLFVLHGNGQVSMLSGNGTGAFSLGPTITIPGLAGTVRDLRVRQFTTSGQAAVMVVTDAPTNNVATIPTNGDLTWGVPVVSSMPAGLGALVIGQFNTSQDAVTDLAFVAPGTNQLFIQLGAGAPTTIALPGQEPIAIKAGHVNKQTDSFLDLVVLNRGSRDVTVLLGNGSGGFAVSGTFPLGASGQRTPSLSPDALALADFNNDGILDVAVASDAPIGQEGQSVVVLLGNGVGGLGAGLAHNVGAGPLTLAAADLDNDGNLDIATANPSDNSIAVLHGDGAGNFGPAAALTAGNTPRGIIAVDVTNDGKPGLVVANQFQRESVSVDEVSTITSAASGPGPFAVTTTNDAGPGSLRQAMTNANARLGLDTISFNIPGAGPHVIALTSSLPVVTDPVTIDGTTQPGYTATPLVELNGAGISGQSFGVEISAPGSTVRGLAIVNFAPGESGHGLLVNAGAGGTFVQGNYVGLPAAATPLSDNTLAFGVVAMAPTLIGGGPASRNVIAGAATSAITLGNGGSNVFGNYIGTTVDGSAAALSNATGTGIDITQGGPYLVDLNVVSGLFNGILVNQPVTGLTFTRNLVGTNAGGDAAVQGPANGTGVAVLAPNTTIGGATAPTGNTIAGYTTGIVVAQPGNALIRNNRIGTSADGLTLLPGVVFGIALGSPNSTVTGNIIASTTSMGVSLQDAQATGNSVTDNVIRDNANAGIGAPAQGGSGNTLVPNTFTNNGLSIDLNLDGPTANDPGDADSGPNDLQNFPGLTGATPNGATTLVTGVLHSTPNGAFTIHIFQNAFCPATGRGEGTVIGTVAMSTGADGRGSFTVALPVVAPGSFLSATATNLTGSTSELSDCVNVAAPPGVGTTLAFVAQPSNSAVNAVINPAVAVAAYDDGDGVADVPVTLQLQGGNGLSGTLVRLTNANGVATFDDLSLGLPVSNVTLLATAPGFEPTTSTSFGALLPDLVVQSLTHTPANPATGSPITFDAVVRNVGNAAAGASTARWSVTPGPNAELTQIPALAPGATFAIQRQVTLNVAQAYVSNLAVDFTNLAAESNEANNTASENFTVTGEGAGELTGHWEGRPPGAGLVLAVPGACPGYNVTLDVTQNGGNLSGTAWATQAGAGTCTGIFSVEQSNGQRLPSVLTGTVSDTDVSIQILARRFSAGVPNSLTAVLASGTVSGNALALSGTLSPARTWLDSNGNLIPECDLANPAANGECGALSGPVEAVSLNVAQSPSTADISLQISDAPDPAVVGENVVYTFATTNRGPSPANAVTLSGNFAAGLSFVSATGGCVFGQPCALGTILPGEVRTITVTMLATSGGLMNVDGSVAAAEPDPSPADNSDAETTTVSLPTVTLSATDPNASEVGPDPGTFTFTRTGPTTSALLANYSISSISGISGTDYTPELNGTVTFGVGQASATITLTPVLDALVEGTEDIQFTLVPAATFSVGAPSTGTVTITDAPVITIQATDASASEAGPDPGTFTITSSSLAAATVNFTVTGTASSGTDYASLGVSVLKPAGVNTVTLTVAPVQDGVPEGAEDVTVTLAAGAYAIGAANAATVTISDSSALSVVNTNDNGLGSLREALVAANANGDVSTITFNIPGAGPHVINVPSLLPSITQPVLIDGTTQPGYSGVPLIHLMATAGGGGRGIQINGANSTVRGLSITGFSGSGIAILSAGGGNVIEANYLGVTPAGLASANANGLSIVNSLNNRIGGTTAGAGNVISGNAPNLGLRITGAASSGNLVVGNLIGLNPAGATALPNTGGILIDGAGSNNTIGGNEASERNVVSGNGNNGIVVAASPNTTIIGNYIGTHVSGATAVANAGSGIVVQSGAANTTIGGAAAGTGNVISGNGGRGIHVIDATSTGTVIAGNRIGTDVTGGAALGNGSPGVELEGGPTTVGGTVPGARNLISGNAVDGIAIESNGNVVQGNFIGTNAGGSNAIPNLFQGVFMEDGAANNVVGGLVPAARNVISGNGVDGVQIGRPGGAATSNNQVIGNYIGTDPGGTAPVPNGFNGVSVRDGTGNIIGGTVGGARNVISGNTQSGVWLDPATQSATGNFVQGNYIGVNAAGAAALPNTLNGVHTGGANTIGGTVVGAQNVISGNGNYGVLIVSNAPGTLVQGNYIGLNAAGAAAIPNTRAGVASGTSGATIGGTAAGAGNVISGNGLPANPAFGNGIEFTAGGSNTVQGNLIGTNASGTAAIPNLGRGVNIFDSSNNLIGGTIANARNVISGNGAASLNAGVQVGGTGTGNQVLGNYIGTDVTGTFAVPNNRGVVLSGSSATLGGPLAGEGNVIAFNTRAGVFVFDNSVNGAAVNNRIRGNRVFSNGNLGIDLGLGAGENGVTANDVADVDLGPNNRQNFPVVTLATPGITTIQGTLNSLANTAFGLDFYASPSCDASGNGEGERYLGTFTVNTDGSGNVAFSSNVASAPQAGEFVTATATDPSGNTSEFSACIQVSPTTVQVFVAAVGSENGPTPGQFSVVRSGAPPFPAPLDVSVSLAGGTATPGTDFTPAGPTVIVTIPANTNFATFPITVIDDDEIEGGEVVQVTVLAGAGYVPTGGPASVPITDNDGVGQIAGTITTAGDLPIAFSFAYVYNADGVLIDAVFTDVDGIYLTNPLPVGSYFVRTYNFQGFIDELYDNIVCSPDCAVTSGTPITVSAGQTAGDIDFQLDLGGTVGGTVTSTSNELGVPFATLELRREGVNDPNLFVYTQADDLGVYEVTGLVPGNYFVRTLTGLVDEVWSNITCVGCDPTSGTPIQVSIASVTNNIDFSLADGARIAGTVIDATTTMPLASAPVQIFTATGQLVGTALTDGSGGYSSTGLTPGTYYARTKNDFVGGPLGGGSGVFGYADELFSEIDCAAGCAVTSGTPITVGAAGTVTSGINFSLSPPTGIPSIIATDPTATEGGLNVATFSVTVSGPSDVERFAAVVATGGTATYGVDYTVTSPDLWFESGGVFVVRLPAGQVASTLTLSAAADGIAEGSETVELAAGFSLANATISD